MTQDKKNLKKKRRAVIMLLIVVVIFSLCWLPYQVYFLISIFYPLINNFKFINLIFLISHWLAMSNSCCNPFIYCLCSPQFRLEFRQLIMCCWRKRDDTDQTTDDNLDDDESVTNTTNLLSIQMSIL